ncbi:MAG: methyl-accepting chemotaxis protein, partial [Burkholderiales bacterium]|nr:methyl-accepting chemotaxis protein [Burkholderiales bacterium]
REQSSGIEQVNQAVAQMDEATQQNAALVEEVAASAESLKTQMRIVSDAMVAFKLTQGAEHAATPVKLEKPVASVTKLSVKKASAKAGKAAAPKARKMVNAKAGDDAWQEF